MTYHVKGKTRFGGVCRDGKCIVAFKDWDGEVYTDEDADYLKEKGYEVTSNGESGEEVEVKSSTSPRKRAKKE